MSIENNLAPVPESGKPPTPPESRLSTVAAGNEIVSKLLTDDIVASKNRADVQRMLDGEAPFDENVLEETGQSHRCNLNFGEGEAMLAAAVSSFYDLPDSVDKMAEFFTKGGDPASQDDAQQIMGEEFHHSVKSWDEFEGNFQQLVLQFVAHGIAVPYFLNRTNPWWQVVGLENFKAPRGVRTCAPKIPVAVVLRDADTTELYKYIMDEEAAKLRGWNVEETRAALVKAHDSTSPVSQANWEELARKIKGNDINFGVVSGRVRLAHIWVLEYDGSVSNFITLRDGGNKDFLFKEIGAFKSVDECYTLFTYGVGTNGMLHAIRGLAHKIFPFVQVSNQTLCQMVDGARLSSSLVLQPEDETAMEDMAITNYGGVFLISPGVKVVEKSIPNLATNALPVARELSTRMQMNTGSYQARRATSDSLEKTKFEIQAEIQADNTLTTSAVNLFYHPWGKLLSEMAFRFCDRNLVEGDDGAEEVFAWRERCKARGVTDDQIFGVYRVSPVRAIGYGSANMRLLALDDFMSLYGSLDDVGKNNLLRDRFAAHMGYSQVDRYVPKLQTVGGRPTMEAKIAELETAVLLDSGEAHVTPGDNNLIHARVHIPLVGNKMQELLNMTENGKSPGEELEEEDVQGMKNAIDHVTEHIKKLSTDAIDKQEVAQMNSAFAQISGNFEGLARNFMAAQQKKAEQPADGGQPDPKAQSMLALTQAKIEAMQQQVAAKIQIMQQAAQAKLALHDAATAHRMKVDQFVKTQNLRNP